MASSAQKTIASLFPGERVILNLGCYGFRGNPGHMPYAKRVQAYSRELRMLDLFEGYYSMELQLPPYEEPVLVVSGVLSGTANLHTGLYELLANLHQDCCAIYYPTLELGCLFGPSDDVWGPFNLALFKMPEQ